MRLRPSDRLSWIALTRIWRNWRTALVLVHPDTVVRWHRNWLGRRWSRRSSRPDGRPPVDSRIVALVREMATANPLWGAPRIHGELRMLGIDMSERTVSRLLQRDPRPPSQTWKTFLMNHLASVASMDFFTVPALTERILFVLIVLSHNRRRIVHVNVTDHPTATWAAQRVVDAFPDDTAPRCYIRYYHRTRTHLAQEKDTPDHRPVSTSSMGPIVAIAEVDGLHHRYERRAAKTPSSRSAVCPDTHRCPPRSRRAPLNTLFVATMQVRSYERGA